MAYGNMCEMFIGLLAWTFIVREAFEFWLNMTSVHAAAHPGVIRRRMIAGLWLMYAAGIIAYHGLEVMKTFPSAAETHKPIHQPQIRKDPSFELLADRVTET
ncbi:hypothetical protein [Bradyrhizobium sp.]